MPPVPASALVALHVAVALFGFAGLFGRWLALPPTAIVLGRTLVAALALAAVLSLRGGLPRPVRGFAANGIVLALHWVAFFEAIQRSSVAIGLLGYATFPLFVLLLERVLLGRRLHAREALTAALVVAGLVIIVPRIAWHDEIVQGLAFGTLSAFTFALLAVRNRSYAAAHAPEAVALWQNAFAALALLPVVAIAREAIGSISPRDVGMLIVLGVFCTALAHSLFIASLARVSAHAASVVAALEPVYGIALAAAFLQEIPSTRTLVGATMIVGAAIVASRRSG